jgi:hypothetical protein
MIDNITLTKATKLKKTQDAAYKLFKRKPSTENAGIWTTSNKTFTDFCVTAISDLIDEDKLTEEEILERAEEYKVCKHCGADVIYKVGNKQFISNVNFVEGFPGWCFDCLLDYCVEHECEGCKVNPKYLSSNCPFAEVKKLYMQKNN